MKQIEISQLIENSSDGRVLFFTEEGKLILENGSPFLSAAAMLNRSSIALQHAHANDKISVVRVGIKRSEEELKCEGLDFLHPRDYFLSIVDQPEVEEKFLCAAHWAVANHMIQFCSHCGASLEKVLETTEKKCPQCHKSFFPKLSPAVLVLIQRGDEILLARGPQHSPEMYTVLAGFIDLGESAEQTVHREVCEEVGLEVTNLKYFGSQSWPFPDSFMIAFTADYLRGEIKIDPVELEEARWFHRNELPLLPPPSTLSRKLIDDFISRTAL